jgi:predicted amidohydrolase YtcJ
MIKIERCYDSHLHLLATGELECGLKLFNLKSPSELSQLKLQKSYFRGDWLTGFGWNQYLFPNQQLPTASDLDQIFPDFPVSLIRIDGHASWLNSVALKKIGYFQKRESEKPTPEGGFILRDSFGFPTGIFVDLAKIMADQFIPQASLEQQNEFLQIAIRKLNSRGFTHARDMSGTLQQWNLLKKMDQQGALTLYLEQNFTCETLKDFERALFEVRQALKNPSPHLRVAGIKVYLDGALGSSGAFLSQAYPHSENRGLVLWSEQDLIEVIRKSWQNHLAVAIHGIGDAAAELIARLTWQVWQSGLKGKLSLEHGELISPATIEILSKMDVTVFMQPCHFLSDRIWLKEKLGPLYASVFPWRKLQQRQIKLYWGSDSPIEEPNLFSNRQALAISEQEGIEAFQGEWWKPHQHPDPSWGGHCSTEISENKVLAVHFDKQRLF